MRERIVMGHKLNSGTPELKGSGEGLDTYMFTIIGCKMSRTESYLILGF